MSGDARERCDVGVSLHKSFLFLQTPSATGAWGRARRKARAAARLAPRAVKCGHREKQLKGRKSRDTLSRLEALTTVQKKHRDPMDVRRPAPKGGPDASSFVLSPYQSPQLVPKLRKLSSR